ncbi:MAG TPA: hypothetical protein VNN80_05440, partial [Polyangiaceae bacterium]|nr:hypothetical protein [Polyangiaceae bacterium]
MSTTNWRHRSRRAVPLWLWLGVLACRSDLATSPEPSAPRAEVPAAQGSPGPASPASAAREVGWDAVPGILERIRPPTIPALECNIVKYGAVPGGDRDATAAIRRALEDCASRGGGRVL